ncbi:MAG: DNA repair protein RadC [Candidatus Brennerbacteria bacterium]|nr:DNA repair protein RadC [Candidatus Brennerbacteria bacterium]
MTYVIKNKLSIIANSGLSACDNTQTGKNYVFTIRDLPNEDRPREKLLALGPGALTPKELLAIVLEKGTRKEGVLAMTERVVREYGESNIFSNIDAKKLSEDLKIPLTKAMQVVAVGELGRRFFERSRNGAAVIRTAKDVFEYVTDMRGLSKEHLRGLYLNAHYQLIHDEVISIGTVDANVIHPREVFRPALSCSAVAVILAHNHPSGVLTPSADDVHITTQIKEAGVIIGIELVDHVIVSKEGFASI